MTILLLNGCHLALALLLCAIPVLVLQGCGRPTDNESVEDKMRRLWFLAQTAQLTYEQSNDENWSPKGFWMPRSEDAFEYMAEFAKISDKKWRYDELKLLADAGRHMQTASRNNARLVEEFGKSDNESQVWKEEYLKILRAKCQRKGDMVNSILQDLLPDLTNPGEKGLVNTYLGASFRYNYEATKGIKSQNSKRRAAAFRSKSRQKLYLAQNQLIEANVTRYAYIWLFWQIHRCAFVFSNANNENPQTKNAVCEDLGKIVGTEKTLALSEVHVNEENTNENIRKDALKQLSILKGGYDRHCSSKY